MPVPSSVLERGACLDTDVNMTPGSNFKQGFNVDLSAEEWAAQQVCLRCPVDVAAECRAWGIADPTVAGVVGGLTESERRRERKKPKPQPLLINADAWERLRNA